MPNRLSGSITETLAVLGKDIVAEFRTRYAFGAFILFGITTLIVIGFASGQSELPIAVLATLLWTVLFFSAMSGLSLTFIKEEESKTSLILRLIAAPVPIYLGKLLFNFLLMVLLEIVVIPLFFILTDAIPGNLVLFVTIMLIGSAGLAGTTTLIAAIISRSDAKGTLLTVLSFPLLLPFFIGAVGGTLKALLPSGSFGSAASELQFLVCYAVVMITAGLLLFEFIWEE